MSNFAYYFALGAVPSMTVIPHQWFEHIEQNLVKAPNFDGGGTYAPSAPITVSGSGMTIKLVGVSSVEAASVLDVYGGIDIKASGGFECASYANFYGDTSFAFSSVFFGGIATFDTGSFLVVNGTLTAVDVTATVLRVTNGLYTESGVFTGLSGPLTVSGIANLYDTNIHGDANLNGTTYLNGTTVVQADLTLTGAGSIQERVVVGADADATYSVSTADLVFIDPNTQTGSHDYTLDQVGAASGKKIRFSYYGGSAANTVRILNSAGPSELAILGNSAGKYSWVDIQYVAGAWKRVAGSLVT
ncbi:MAG TPA: hypothetical protein VJV79_02860 [Polyangiaceae bacterium]|nr:hypothetical protein [Polyangiaceae bacterium]